MPDNETVTVRRELLDKLLVKSDEAASVLYKRYGYILADEVKASIDAVRNAEPIDQTSPFEKRVVELFNQRTDTHNFVCSFMDYLEEFGYARTVGTWRKPE